MADLAQGSVSEIRQRAEKGEWYALKQPKSIPDGVAGKVKLRIRLDPVGSSPAMLKAKLDAQKPRSTQELNLLADQAHLHDDDRHGKLHRWDIKTGSALAPKKRREGPEYATLEIEIVRAKALAALDKPEGGAIMVPHMLSRTPRGPIKKTAALTPDSTLLHVAGYLGPLCRRARGRNVLADVDVQEDLQPGECCGMALGMVLDGRRDVTAMAL